MVDYKLFPGIKYNNFAKNKQKHETNTLFNIVYRWQ